MERIGTNQLLWQLVHREGPRSTQPYQHFNNHLLRQLLHKRSRGWKYVRELLKMRLREGGERWRPHA